MCGIFASIAEAQYEEPSEMLKRCLCLRGPDSSRLLKRSLSDSSQSSPKLCFFSTVLSLRGDTVAQQPLTDENGRFTLCWNGEAWKVEGQILAEHQNDGQVIFEKLENAASIDSRELSQLQVLDVMRLIEGPFAFIFFDRYHQLLYFGRDCLGRRSLLFNAVQAPGVVQFSSVSVAPHEDWLEVEADGIYVLDCHTIPSSSPPNTASQNVSFRSCIFPVSNFPWSSFDAHHPGTLSLGKLNFDIPDVSTGGDSHVLSSSSPSVEALASQLRQSLALRIVHIPDAHNTLRPEDARLAVLFSGGLDCTVLARLAHDLLPANQSIDLLNVAFENPRVVQAAINQAKRDLRSDQPQESCYEVCPDRITGRNALRELQQICPDRRWRFVEVSASCENVVCSLTGPEMDLSIGFALYFAARGIGRVEIDGSANDTYATTARVLLSGLGADELFGGYGRHAVAFSRNNFQGLLEELELDVNRLGKRNLGRDDRVMSNWGKEVRFPYLDENLVRWALQTPVWDKCGFGNEGADGEEYMEPDKKVLRLVARELGLKQVSREKKRAIQFGARTAKMETGRTKGTTLIS